MNVTFRCSSCQQTNRVDFDEKTSTIPCAHCQRAIAVPAGAVAEGRVHRCLVCPSTELFARKDFPQRLGVAIVIVGFALSCLAWNSYRVYATFGILFATALVDLALYVIMGESLNCYRCDAQYRGLESLAGHRGFDLATHERYRQQAARLAQHAPPGSHDSVGR